jgi:hypothetical protein
VVASSRRIVDAGVGKNRKMMITVENKRGIGNRLAKSDLSRKRTIKNMTLDTFIKICYIDRIESGYAT